MEFITVEQFKEQPKEVQEVFLDWWKCEPFNIYAWCWNLKDNKWSIESCCNQIQADTINKGKTIGDIIPLFTEGQLRKFIEDKSNGTVKLIQWHIEDSQISKRGYAIDILRKNEYHVTYHYKDLGEDLLKAYWKVACIVAKEDLNE